MPNNATINEELKAQKPKDLEFKIFPHYSVVNIARSASVSMPVVFFEDIKRTVGIGRTSMNLSGQFQKGEDFRVVGIAKIFPAGIIAEADPILVAKDPYIELKVGNEVLLELPLFLVKNIETKKGGATTLIEITPGDYTKLAQPIDIPAETHFELNLKCKNGDFSSTSWPALGQDIGFILFGGGYKR